MKIINKHLTYRMKEISILCLLLSCLVHAENLLFIAIDDLSSRIRSLGDPYAITPNLDRIYNESTVFTKQFATSPECGPSRTSMLTSLKVENHRVEHFEHFRGLNPRVITLPGLLRSNGGYFTSGVGKVFDFWNFGGRSSSEFIKPDLCSSKSIQCSFDRFYSYNEIILNKTTTPGNILFKKSDDNEILTDDYILRNSISQLQGFNESRKKFALFVGITKPHMPFTCHDSFYKMYDNLAISAAFTNMYNMTSYFKTVSHPYFKSDSREARKYSGFQVNNPNQYARGHYACISQSDSIIGRLVDVLDNLSAISNNTFVVIWGDHGFSVGERNIFGKKVLYENTNKSPFMIRFPPSSRVHNLIETPISNIDIYPTIAELLNVNVVQKIDGTSTVKLMNRDINHTHPVPFSSFYIYGPSSLIGISKWYKTNTTMTIHKRSSSNRLKPITTPYISRVYKPNTNERELL